MRNPSCLSLKIATSGWAATRKAWVNEMPGPKIHISDVFKHVSYYRRKGHQIGRKVGDMLEVLTMAAMNENHDIRSRMLIEPNLRGFSGANHKVEFAICSESPQSGNSPEINKLLAFIECKKVGVEQTINGTFKKNFKDNQHIVPYETSISFSLKPKWLIYRIEFDFVFTNKSKPRIRVHKNKSCVFDSEINEGNRFMFGSTVKGDPFFIDDNQSLRDIEPSIGICKILEIGSISKNGVGALLNDCLAGPQTPEKAKQASFVALDIRKERFGQFDKRDNEREMVSILILTEISHWEDKSRNMVRACIDHNLVVRDDIIVYAFKKFEEKFGENFLEHITKSKVGAAAEVSSLCREIVNRFNLELFTDLDTGKARSIQYHNGSIILT